MGLKIEYVSKELFNDAPNMMPVVDYYKDLKRKCIGVWRVVKTIKSPLPSIS